MGQAEQVVSDVIALKDSLRMTLSGVASNRLRDERLVARDPKGAQGATDALALAQLREDYRKVGLSSKQADSDFALRMQGEAMANGPRIVADSLQRVGGGGGSGGSDVLGLAKRRTEIAQRSEALLIKIVANTEREAVVR